MNKLLRNNKGPQTSAPEHNRATLDLGLFVYNHKCKVLHVAQPK